MRPETPEYRPEIDGLRAIAVVLVVVFHAFPSLMPAGFVGVDIFFVISGFLITGIITRQLDEGSFSLARFYARRIRRIFPALIVVLLATLVIGGFWLLPAAYARLSSDAAASAAFVANIAFYLQSGYFDVASSKKPLLHLWSLGIEEQFYLAWPLILLLVSRTRLGRLPVVLAIGLASFGLNVALVDSSPVATFYLPFTRAWELVAGAALACGWSRIPHGAVQSTLRAGAGIAMIVAALLLMDQRSTFPGWWALLPVAGTAFLISAPHAWGANAALKQPWLVHLGLVSYPLYLWHWPLLKFAGLAGYDSAVPTSLVVVVSFVLAFATNAAIERPIRFGALKPIGVALASVSMLIVAVASFATSRDGGALWRYPPEIRPVLAVMNYDIRRGTRVDECWLHGTATYDKYSPECRKGQTLVWGDSHAGMFFPSLGDGTAVFIRTSCPPIVGETSLPAPCQDSNFRVLQEIARIKPARVILFAVWGHYPLNPDALASTMKALSASTRELIVLGPAPWFEPSLPEQVHSYWQQHKQLPDRLQPKPLEYADMDAKLRSAADSAGAHFISLYSTWCNEQGCLTHTPKARSALLTFDYGHLTIDGARLVATFIDQESH